tara:strand:+ start:1270 stop:3423 length:2154 start_codon:yes stop_codon:yes gene_type:complete
MTMANSTKPSLVDETQDLYNKYKQRRETWAHHAKEDREFRLGRQWTKEQSDHLQSRGQAPIVINRIHPAVETAKAMLTANRPSFRCSPREDSDRKVANVMSALLAYCYDISDGRNVIRESIDDYYVTGLGYVMVYQDPTADDGKGEVKITDIDPMDVFVDPNARHRMFDDAENIIISRQFTKAQAMKLYPMYAKKIKNAGSNYSDDRPVTQRTDSGEVHFPEDVGNMAEEEYVRGYERYYKMDVDKYRTYETWSKREELLDEEVYLNEYVERPAWIINGQIVTDEQQADALIRMGQQKIIQAHQQNVQNMMQQGYDPETVPYPEQQPSAERTTFGELVAKGAIEVVQVSVRRICQVVVMGDKFLYKRVLPCEKYPIVPIINIHTRTPYPTSDVRMVKGIQEYINKTRSLIIAHATTSTNTKILVPEGSVDMSEFEQKWAQPGVAIPYDPTDGPPVPVQPSPLPNEIYNNEQTAKADIDHALGLYEMMMGNSQAAPQTYKATISLDEFGQRKIKSKLADIESALSRVGQVAVSLIQQLYTTEKVFRVIQPNNSLSEYVINKRLVDDKKQEVMTINDMTIGKYDVIVVAGSTLPSNRYAELEFYMDAYAKGLIDRQEVLKKTEVFDVEGVMQRMDVVAQLQQKLQQSGEQIKKLKGDLQTRDRESVNLRKKVEVEKFKTGLDKTQNKASAAASVFEKRLGDEDKNIRAQVQQAAKSASK